MPKLIDGTEVDTNSEEWRHECEARAILALPNVYARRAWLEDIEARRGHQDANELRKTMLVIHKALK